MLSETATNNILCAQKWLARFTAFFTAKPLARSFQRSDRHKSTNLDLSVINFGGQVAEADQGMHQGQLSVLSGTARRSDNRAGVARAILRFPRSGWRRSMRWSWERSFYSAKTFISRRHLGKSGLFNSALFKPRLLCCSSVLTSLKK
jgi:hypothetical protein